LRPPFFMLKSDMDYLDFWQQKGTKFITPSDKENPEGFDVQEVLNMLIKGKLCEVGCGTGRIAKGFIDYVGVDINPKALEIAREKYPHKDFRLTDLEEPYPEAGTTLFYTVCLHIPDDLIESQLKRVRSDRIIIAEIMDRSYRKNEEGYTWANNRDIEDYNKILGTPKTVVNIPYEHYKDTNITFAVYDV